jgi:LacI family repressor for deo operon, udp, cdd, tsx, nupC, and nupG
LSIIGFDNISLSEFCDPPLTTVAQPRFDIGREAMLLLLDQLHGQTVSSGSRLLDCELIVRGTYAKLSKRLSGLLFWSKARRLSNMAG